MVSKLKAWFQWFWYSHVQKTAGFLLASLASMDLAGYRDDISALIGERKYHAIRLFLGAIVVIRAITPSKQ